jgi:hypothetical protein
LIGLKYGSESLSSWNTGNQNYVRLSGFEEDPSKWQGFEVRAHFPRGEVDRQDLRNLIQGRLNFKSMF